MKALYSIRDERLNFWNPPFPADSDGACKAAVRTAVTRDPSLRVFARDQAAYQVGEFDDETGRLLPVEPRLVCRCSEFVGGDLNEAQIQTTE